MVSEKHKAYFHGILTVAAIAEGFTCKSNWRKLLVGVCAGWHLAATLDHINDARMEP